MDDRPENTNAPPINGQARKPLNQNQNYRPRGEQRFENRDEKFQSGAAQNRDRNFQPRDGKFRPRSNDASNGGARVQNQDGKLQPRGENFERNNRFGAKDKNFKPRRQPPAPAPPPPIVSEMQITDGKHRGIFLQTSASAKARLTARRVREVMFRILHRRARAGRFLDLCAGSGMVGLEAVSRGALLATFVERSTKMCSIVRMNMEACGVKAGHGEVVCAEAAPYLKQAEKRRRTWDVVYYDPPYDADYNEVLDFFARGAALKPRGVLVIEHHAEMFFPETLGAMKRWRVLVQNETALSFYEKS